MPHPMREMKTRAEPISKFHLLRRSPAAQQIAARCSEIDAIMRERPQKIWPVAKVARLFGISSRLLWKWIDEGALTRHKPSREWRKDSSGNPLRCHRKGLTRQAVVKFVRGLADTAQFMAAHPRPKSSPAKQRCLALFKGLNREDMPTPMEFASRAGVSISNVRRLIRYGWLKTAKVSRGRFRIRKKW
jgi:hypothetical protein